MTDSYNQNNINLQDSTPIVVTTLSVAPVRAILGTIVNGQTLTVSLAGGGSAPSALALNHYVVGIANVATFVREAGVGALAGGGIVLIQVGAVTLTFGLDDAVTPGVTTCFLSIVGPAIPCNHNLWYSSAQF